MLRVSYATAKRRLLDAHTRGVVGVRREDSRGHFGERYVVELAHLETVRAACERRELRDDEEAVAA